MTSASEGPTGAGPAFNSGDDKIELELATDHGPVLSRAPSAEHHADDSDLVPARPEYLNFALRRTARIEFVCNVTLAVLAVAFAVAFLWPRSHRHPSVPAVASIASLGEVISTADLASAAEPPEPQGSPVRIPNAFDATEVFEFPPGTSESDAREAVAELLLNRARERRAERLTLRQAQSRPRMAADRGTVL